LTGIGHTLTTASVKPPPGRQIDEGKAKESTDEASHPEDRTFREEEDGPWYFGKAKEEFNRRRNGGDVNRGRGEEEDPIQVWISFIHQFPGSN